MAHPIDMKARALALLALGNTPRYVAKQLGIPRTTAQRWQKEARVMLREIVGDPLAAALATIGGGLPGMGQEKKSDAGQPSRHRSR